MMSTRSSCVLLSAALLAACRDNPYPETGTLSPVPVREAVRPSIHVIDPQADEMVFHEGVTGDYRINFSVSEGEPVIRFEGLPEGAAFDEEEGLLTWTPGYETASENGVPVRRRHFAATAWLSSSASPRSAVSKRLILRVNNAPRPIEVKVASSNSFSTVEEGETLTFQIDVESEDFPDGPFVARGVNTPDGMTIREKDGDPSAFIVEYSPDHDVVRQEHGQCASGTGSSCHERFRDVAFEFTAPDGRRARRGRMMVSVKDVRLPVHFGTAGRVEIEPPGGTFTITAFDQNREDVPAMTLKTSPSFGTVESRVVTEEEPHHTASLQVSWKNVPPGRAGETGLFTVSSCPSIRLSYAVCQERTVEAVVVPAPDRRPVVERDAWPDGEVKTFLMGETASFFMPFKDRRQSVPDVAVVPEELGDMVLPGGRSGRGAAYLTIKALRPGVHHARLEATGRFGATRREHVSFEVLPPSWTDTIYVGVSPKDASLGFYGAAGAGYFSPLVHADDPRALLRRDALVVSTEALAEGGPALGALLGDDRFKRVFVASPLLGDLPAGFREALEEAGVVFEGRLSELHGPTDPSSWDVVVVDRENGIEPPPQGRAFLRGDASAESADPMLLDLSRTMDACDPLMVLKRGRDEYYISVSCPLPGGGRAVLSGFEWGDLDPGPGRDGAVLGWYRSLMGGD